MIICVFVLFVPVKEKWTTASKEIEKSAFYTILCTINIKMRSVYKQGSCFRLLYFYICNFFVRGHQ